MANVVKISGIKETSKALREVSKDAQKELRKGMLEIADTVARAASAKVPSVSGAAAASIKPKGSVKGASISMGGPSAPYYPWLDFGGSVGRGHKAKQAGSGSIKRPFIKEGRFLYPTIGEHKDYIGETAYKLLADLAEKHGLEVKR